MTRGEIDFFSLRIATAASPSIPKNRRRVDQPSGVRLRQQGKLEQPLASLNEAIRLDPESIDGFLPTAVRFSR